MKKKECYETRILQTVFPDTGIAEIEGHKVLIKHALEGQYVRCRISKIRSNKVEASLLEVLEPSPLETVSNCPHFGFCGGCAYQTMCYEDQIALKSRQMTDLLKAYLPKEQPVVEVLPSPNRFGYRNKMELTFGDAKKDGPLELGLHKSGAFYDIMTVPGCCIMDEDFRKIAGITRDFFAKQGVPYYHRMRHEGILRHLLIRKGEKTGELLVDLVTADSADPEYADSRMKVLLEEWKETLLAEQYTSRIAGILHTTNNSLADAVKDEGTQVLFGQDHFYEELLGLQFKITPFSFFQTNSAGAEVLYETAREFLGDTRDRIVYDLYSGTGTIAQMLAPAAKEVIGVEIVPEAVEAAKANAELNKLENVSFLCGDVLKALDRMGTGQGQACTDFDVHVDGRGKEAGDASGDSNIPAPDLIVLDPPRDGIHPKALKKIIDYGVERMIYISCKPTSLVRDLEVLEEGGYRVERAAAVDMFPGTAHVETVVLLSRKSIKETSYLDLTISTDKKNTGGKATYAEIQEYVKAQFGLSVSHLYIAQVKDKCGIKERENYNIGEGKSAVPVCPPEKEKAIMDALKFFGML